ncbi:hypothetical protein [Clostridium grantii]|uniref:Uncharacterized protein n=1 Tax=Clostridium grantii DSM 8605 TaxID=1121316 RepID=A0A1M5SV20_9CLOT|nr:hypothetical protein [Clostridium grantii]SHH42375.1 hypothetical protein SAMN02745207_01051 [Clostridium grantii DSM 8605]
MKELLLVLVDFQKNKVWKLGRVGYVVTTNITPIRSQEERNSEILGRISANRWAHPLDLMALIIFLV